MIREYIQQAKPPLEKRTMNKDNIIDPHGVQNLAGKRDIKRQQV